MHRVRVLGERPDYRVLIALFYSDLHSVDTEGDSHEVQSRNWTSLYLKDRQSDEPSVDIEGQVVGGELLFTVHSDAVRLEELAAIYLYEYCGDRIEADGRALSDVDVRLLQQRYAPDLERGRTSVFHRSSNKVPHPHIQEKTEKR